MINFSQADTNNRDVHPKRSVPQHAVLHLAGGALAARGGRHHAAHSRADEAIRYVTHRTLGVTSREEWVVDRMGGNEPLQPHRKKIRRIPFPTKWIPNSFNILWYKLHTLCSLSTIKVRLPKQFMENAFNCCVICAIHKVALSQSLLENMREWTYCGCTR